MHSRHTTTRPALDGHMRWRWMSALLVPVFAVLAVRRVVLADPLLWVIVYLGAIAVSVSTVRGRPIPRLALVVLVVFPAEMALVTLLIGPPPPGLTTGAPAPDQLARDALVDILGMLVVAMWAAALAFGRPHAETNDPVV